MTSLPPHGSLRRRSVLRALGVAASRVFVPGLWLAGSAQPARASEAELTGFEVIRDEDGVFLSYVVNFELGKGPEDALAKSVPLFFVAEAEIFRDRWYWRDRRVAHATRVWKFVYQPLTDAAGAVRDQQHHARRPPGRGRRDRAAQAVSPARSSR